jgi:hypothetical protein
MKVVCSTFAFFSILASTISVARRFDYLQRFYKSFSLFSKLKRLNACGWAMHNAAGGGAHKREHLVRQVSCCSGWRWSFASQQRDLTSLLRRRLAS